MMGDHNADEKGFQIYYFLCHCIIKHDRTNFLHKTAKNKSQLFQEPKLWDILIKDKLVTCTKRNPIKLITNQYTNLCNTITQGVELKLLQHTCMNHALLLFIPNLPNSYIKLSILLIHNAGKLKLLCRIMKIG